MVEAEAVAVVRQRVAGTDVESMLVDEMRGMRSDFSSEMRQMRQDFQSMSGQLVRLATIQEKQGEVLLEHAELSNRVTRLEEARAEGQRQEEKRDRQLNLKLVGWGVVIALIVGLMGFVATIMAAKIVHIN